MSRKIRNGATDEHASCRNGFKRWILTEILVSSQPARREFMRALDGPLRPTKAPGVLEKEPLYDFQSSLK